MSVDQDQEIKPTKADMVVPIDLSHHEIEDVPVPADLIQINATGAEMKRRIEALIASKKEQINKRNELDFFNKQKERSHCARIDAELLCKRGGKSHLEVKSATNVWGPQTAVPNPTTCTAPDDGKEKQPASDLTTGSEDTIPENLNIPSNFKNISSQNKAIPSHRQDVYPSRSTNSKKIYSVDEVDSKIERLRRIMDAKQKKT